MEFWGVEVKANESLKVTVEDLKLLHISQVALGEVKNVKKVENVPIRVKINDKDFVLGTLSSERAPQIMFDLVFEQDLELSHGWKDGSVYFCGYIADNLVDDDDDGYDFDSSDEENALNFNANGGLQAKPKASLEEVKDEEDSDKDSDEDDDSEDDDSDEDDSEEEKNVKHVKRPAEAPLKSPVPAKKTKSITPQKTDGKKAVHTATPHLASKSNSKKAKKGGK